MDYASLIPSGNRFDRFFAVNPSSFGTVSEMVGRAYVDAYRAGFIGAFVDADEHPTWARQIAAYDKAAFLAEARYGKFTEHAGPIQGLGASVDRCCNWNYAPRVLGDKVYVYRQETGICVYACKAGKAIPQLLGTLRLGLRQPAPMPAAGSTAWYANRGYCGDGSTLSGCAKWHSQGIPFRMVYLDGKYDLRDEDRDERLSASTWCRSGVPSDLATEFKKARFAAISYMDDTGWEACRDVFAAGGVIDTGSGVTASGPCDPVARAMERIGGHCQILGGYDNSPEFRDWYKQTTGKAISEPVLFLHQTWGPGWISLTNWATHLWGMRPEGMVPVLWRHARLLLEEAYSYLPLVDGQWPREKIAWSTAA